MFHKMPYILGASIVFAFLFDRFIPLELKEIIYALSLSIKSIIVFILPLIIFGLLFRAVTTLSKNASWIIGLILGCVCVSNFFSTFLSHYVGMWVYAFDHTLILPEETQGLKAAWSWTLPKLMDNSMAMILGIASGFVVCLTNRSIADKISSIFEQTISKILRLITYVIPLFVFGFIIKLQFDGVMATIVKDYSLIFSIVAVSQFGYIGMAYLVLCRGKINKFIISIKYMLPAALSGFSTMSSASAMPLTILGVESNSKNKDLAKSVVPVTVNIHLVGDCFAIPIFAYAILKNFGMAEPSLIEYLVFALYFVIAKFSVAAIPGGGIIVMLPILESQLGFNAEMMSLITALYILFDPVITAANVLGNGSFAKMIDQVITLIKSPNITADRSH